MDCRVRHLKFKANTIEGIYPHLILADTQNLFHRISGDANFPKEVKILTQQYLSPKNEMSNFIIVKMVRRQTSRDTAIF